MSISPRIASIENLMASDPGGRNIFGLVVPDQLRLAAQSLKLARRVGIVSGFYIPGANAGETDGPPGAKVLGTALRALGIEVDYLTDDPNVPIFRTLGLEPITETGEYLARYQPTHLVSVERPGRAADGCYRNMRGEDVTACTAPLDGLFLDAARRGVSTIGIGDGGNEIGMGRVFREALADVAHGTRVACVVPTDFCIVAGVANWGAYGLAGALSVLTGLDLLPPATTAAQDIEDCVSGGGAVDGVTHRRQATVDGLELAESVRMLESIRRQTQPSPFEQERALCVGILGYGETGRNAAALLARHGHRVRVSDSRSIKIAKGTTLDGIETGGHTLEFLRPCDVVMLSPGVRPDAPVVSELHLAGIPVFSELEMAYQFCKAPIVAVTGTVGKRSSVELLEALLRAAGRSISIGGNKGRPLSALLLSMDPGPPGGAAVLPPVGLAVSSYQLESVVSFKPSVAVILNIREAHLERHRSMAEYARIKSRIFMNQHPPDALILNYDDKQVRPLARKHAGRTYFVSGIQEVDRGAWVRKGRMLLCLEGTIEEMASRFRWSFDGSTGERAATRAHTENLLSCVVAARLLGLEADDIRAAMQTLFSGGSAWGDLR